MVTKQQNRTLVYLLFSLFIQFLAFLSLVLIAPSGAWGPGLEIAPDTGAFAT